MIEKFEIIFLEQAREFLKELNEKVKAKIIYNIDKSKILNDPELFKKFLMKSGNLGLNKINYTIDSLLSGTSLTKQKH